MGHGSPALQQCVVCHSDTEKVLLPSRPENAGVTSSLLETRGTILHNVLKNNGPNKKKPWWGTMAQTSSAWGNGWFIPDNERFLRSFERRRPGGSVSKSGNGLPIRRSANARRSNSKSPPSDRMLSKIDRKRNQGFGEEVCSPGTTSRAIGTIGNRR